MLPRNFGRGVGLFYIPRVGLRSRSEMLKSPLFGICVAAAALMSVGAQPAVARDGPGSDFSPITEWGNQISSDLEHNKRYLPGERTRGKIGTVRFELTMNRAGWVLPGTRIVTIDPELGRVALLLLQQSQPFPAPDNFNLRDATFRVVVPIRFNNVPSEGPTEVQGLDRRKLLECYQADREELDYQRRRAARLGLVPPNGVSRTPEGCSEARRVESERHRRAGATSD
jgi:hypothetical protein